MWNRHSFEVVSFIDSVEEEKNEREWDEQDTRKHEEKKGKKI